MGIVVVEAPTLGEGWLAVSRAILEQGALAAYDGQATRELALLTLEVADPSPDDEVIARLGDPRWLEWMHANFFDPRDVAELGYAKSYAARLFDYAGSGRDQLAWLVDRLRADPECRSATITTFQPLTDTSYVPCVSMLELLGARRRDRAGRLRPQPRLRQEGLREPRGARAPAGARVGRAGRRDGSARGAREVGARLRARVVCDGIDRRRGRAGRTAFVIGVRQRRTGQDRRRPCANVLHAMAEHPLPERNVAREWLQTMMLIRRFEERAGEMYAKAKVGGFLHLAIGEEATIVGSARAMRDDDYLISTYRSHGHALVRGTDPNGVMAELFGRVDGVSKGRGGSMHMFDLEKRFMGGYGIVGGNLPIAAGFGLASDYLGTEDATLCTFGDGASNQGTFGETMNLAALWKLPVVFMVTNNQFGMGTALERHSAVTDLQVKGEGFGVPGMECDGMDVLDTFHVTQEALRIAREERRPVLVEAITYRFRGHSMADPEEYRTKEQVEEWRKRDPILQWGDRLEAEG
ncbi:MAG: thiamine pyrophosphate-dependent enzyme, partial [Solirubrobacteraceae bacterium]